MAVNINIPSQVKTYANLAAFPATGALKTIYIAEDTNKTYRWAGSVYTEISASAAMTWGAIGGTLSNQTDLQNALNAKENTITAGTTSQYFRGDKTFQTLDKAAVGLGNVDNTSDANKPISTATQTALNAKQDSLGFTPVPNTRTLTINGVTQDLSANRTFTISTGITIGSTAIASGSVGRILFEGAGNVVQESSSLFWDATNNRLGIGTSSPLTPFDVIATDATILLRNTSSSGYAGINILDDTNTLTGSFQIGGSGVGSGLAGNMFIGARKTNGNLLFVRGSAATISATLFGSTGNFAINTTTDAGFRLDVNGTARLAGNLTFTAGDRFLQFGTGSGTYLIGRDGGAVYVGYNFGTQQIHIGSLNSGNVLFRTTGNVCLDQSTSKLLIGTTTDAGFRLDVNGTARVQGNLAFVTGNTYINSTSNHMWIAAVTSTSTDIQMIPGRQVNINNTGTYTAQASAILQTDSTTKGFLPPRMTTTQKNAIASPAAGLVVYDTTLNKLCVYTTAWETVTSL